MSNQLKSKAVHEEQAVDHMFEPIPMSQRRETWKQVLVWVGFGYVATGLFIGGTLAGLGGGGSMPFQKVIIAIILGMGALFIMTSALGIIAQRTGMSLALVSRYSFGMRGTNLPLLVMALLTLGWFSSITGMVGDIWGTFLGNPSGIIVLHPEGMNPITLEVVLSCIVGGLLFTITAMYGIKGLEMIAVPVSPVILLLAVFVGVSLLSEGGGVAKFIQTTSTNTGLSMSTAVTMLIGSWVAGAIMGIDLFRFNKDLKGVFLGAAACFILTNPLLNIVGYIGMTTVNEPNYVSWMLEKGFFLAVIGVLTWTLSLWTTNDAELYCNANYMGPVFDSYGFKVNKSRLILVVGIIGTILGAMGFYQMFFAKFINYLGVMAPPLAGPILADYFICKKQKYDIEKRNSQPDYNMAGIISALTGMFLGLIFSVKGILVNWPTGLLALFITMVLYVILDRVFSNKGSVIK